MPTPQPGQKRIPIKDWNRFLRVADWWERTFAHRPPGALPPTFGETFWVLTPAGGIPARSGTTIYSATCTKLIEAETGTAGQKTLHETGETLLVYNLDTIAVDGNANVRTGLTKNGTRCVESGWASGAQVIQFRVTASTPFYGTPAIVCSSVVAIVLDVDCSGAGGIEVGDEVIVWDPNNAYLNVPIGVLLNTIGTAVRMRTDESVMADCLYEYPEDLECRWQVVSLASTEDIYGCA